MAAGNSNGVEGKLIESFKAMPRRSHTWSHEFAVTTCLGRLIIGHLDEVLRP